MRPRRLTFGVIAAILLVGLVGLLATLQYRWLGQVSEAEREQLRRSLDQRAREFADDFDAEISRAYLALQMRREALDAGDWSAFAAGVDQWRANARFPHLMRAIYLADASGGAKTLRRYDAATRTFGEPARDWPQHLQPVRDQLTAGPPLPPAGPVNTARFVAIAVMPIAPDVPALLVPVSRQAATADADGNLLPMQWPGTYVVADLDGEYLNRTVLPALVARHFPGQAADSYRVAILAAAGTPVFSRGFPPGAAIDPARADLVTPFFSLRLDFIREMLPAGSQNVVLRRGAQQSANVAYSQLGERMAVVVEHRESDAKTHAPAGVVGAQIRMVRPGWRLVLAHASGSLDVAVAGARRRNAWLSFGILGILAVGVVMVVVNGRRASRLAAQQMDFVATISHELRTPLAVIRSAAQNLSAGVVSDLERARRYGELIEDEGRRLTEMVEQVLEYARITGDKPLAARQSVNIAELARDVTRSCQPLCEEAGVALDVTADPAEAPMVAGDQAALRRALHNLIGNALKHGADGRWIGVKVEHAPARRRKDVLLTVSDRGRGIDTADIGHVFEPFYRGRRAIDEQVHGNGLGLSLVRRVVEAHGGSVIVESAPGRGTTFTMRLPASEAEQA